MSAPIVSQRTLLAAAALAVAAAGFAAWQFHHEVETSRAELAALEANRRQLQSSITQHENRRNELSSQIAPLEAQPPPPAAHGIASASGQEPTPPSGPHGNVWFPELFSDPHYAQAYLAWQRFRTALRFAPAFAQMSLSRNEIARLTEILAEKELANNEVEGILEEQALIAKKPTDRRAATTIQMTVNRTFDEEIERTFGSEVVAKLREFLNGTGARQNWLDAFALRLSYSAHPLTPAQSDALINGDPANRTFGSTTISDTLLARAESILEPDQFAALRKLKVELEAGRGGTTIIRNSTEPRPPPILAPQR